MSADFVMDDVMNLHSYQSPINRRMPSLRRNRPQPYSRPTERSTSVSGDLEASMREGERLLLSLMPAKTVCKPNTAIYTPAVESVYFPRILWNVVENDSHRSIWWSADGTALVIHETMFITEILKKDEIDHLFGTTNIKNFYHQLNLYGFTTTRFDHENHGNPSMVITVEQVKVFAHPYFLKNARHLLARMRRRVVAKAAETSPVTEAFVRGLAAPSLLLAPRLVGLTPQEALVLDQARASLSQDRVVQALQPVLIQGQTLLDPQTLGLTILLATLLNPNFLEMDDSISAAPSN